MEPSAPFFDWPTEPVLLFDAAQSIGQWEFDLGSITYHWLVFARTAPISDENGTLRRGVHLAIFPCDEDGVCQFQERYECEGRRVSTAFYRFNFLFVNFLISPVRVQNERDVVDEERLDSMFYGE